MTYLLGGGSTMLTLNSTGLTLKLTAGDSTELTPGDSTHDSPRGSTKLTAGVRLDSPQERSELIGRQDFGPAHERLFLPKNEALP